MGQRRFGRVSDVETSEHLAAVENALRLAVGEVLPQWLDLLDDEQSGKLVAKRAEEARRRDGVVAPESLLEYVEFYQLQDFVLKNWEPFKPVFDDLQRTRALLGMIADYRNAIAHSRELRDFERNLLAGAAGLLRNQISQFRSHSVTLGRYYPMIESIVDPFNRSGMRSTRGDVTTTQQPIRVEIDQRIRFEGRALPARGQQVRWYLTAEAGNFIGLEHSIYECEDYEVARGSEVEFEWIVSRRHVGEIIRVEIIISGDSRYHRSGGRLTDDEAFFIFAVSPPEDE